MSNVIPTIVELDFHPVVLNVGELYVLDTLLKLDDEWTVYVQPLIGQHRPDFIAAHRAHGVCVVEVKDWQPGSARETEHGTIELADGDRWEQTSESPYVDVGLARRAVVDQFFDGDDNDPSAVRGIVVLAHFSTAKRVRFCAEHRHSMLAIGSRCGAGMPSLAISIASSPATHGQSSTTSRLRRWPTCIAIVTIRQRLKRPNVRNRPTTAVSRDGAGRALRPGQRRSSGHPVRPCRPSPRCRPA